MLNVYEAVAKNKQKTWIVMILFIVFITITAYVFGRAMGVGGLGFVGWALIISGMISFASYWWSDKIILSISGARPAEKKKDFLFYTATENLCLAANLPMPRLYVIEDTAMNAFATGRDPKHAVVCATTGLLSQLNRTELEGVVGHELTHVKNYDIRLMSIVTILVGMVTLLADLFLRSSIYGRRGSKDKGQLGMVIMVLALALALLSPIIAKLIQLAISRRAEFTADAGSVMITRQPSGLIGALRKLSTDREPLEAANKATAHLYIVNPLRNLHSGVGWFAKMFNTHPPVNQRIKELEKMS